MPRSKSLCLNITTKIILPKVNLSKFTDHRRAMYSLTLRWDTEPIVVKQCNYLTYLTPAFPSQPINHVVPSMISSHPIGWRWYAGIIHNRLGDWINSSGMASWPIEYGTSHLDKLQPLFEDIGEWGIEFINYKSNCTFYKVLKHSITHHPCPIPLFKKLRVPIYFFKA